MKRLILLLIGILLISASTFACGGLTQQAQGGELRYSFDSIDPMMCTLTATMYFDINEPVASDSIFVSWGDGTLQYVFGLSVSEDTSVPAGLNNAPEFQHVYQATHHYDSIPAGGFYYPTVLLQYRPSFISNIANGQTNNVTFYIEAQVAPGVTGNQNNRGPVITAPITLFGYVNDTFTYTPTFYDPDGDSVVFTAIQPLEDHATPVPAYVFPDSFCNYYFPGSSGYSVDPHTGKITWTTTCYEGLYTLAFMVSKYRNGQLIGSFIRDQNLYIIGKPAPDCSAGFSLYPNETTPHNWYLLNQANGSPPLSYFWSWGDDSTSTGETPAHAYADSGYYDICLSITDALGCTSSYCDSTTDLRLAGSSIINVQVVTSLPTAVTDLTENSSALHIFPNPVDATLNGTITGLTSGTAIAGIYSMDGRLIVGQVPLTEGNFQLDVSSLPPGVYLFQTSFNGHNVTQRFVKVTE